MTKKLHFYILLILLLGFTLNCQKSSMKKNPQVLRINYFSPPASLHPHFNPDIGTTSLCKALFEGLTRINPQGKIELALAKTVDISPCGKKYTFILKPSKWSNGKDVTSFHFANAWKRALSPKCFHAKRFFLIKNAKQVHSGQLPLDQLGISTPSSTELIVELEHPAPYFLELIASPIYSPLYNDDENSSIFNGPFLIEKYEMDREIILHPNPFYWDAQTVKLKKIKISLIKDAQTALYMYEKDQLDFLGSPFSTISDEAAQNFANIKSKKASAPFWLFCNTQNPKLQSVHIRKALSYAIDRKEVIKHILPNQTALLTILPEEISLIDTTSMAQANDLVLAQELFNLGLKTLNLDRSHFQITLNYSTVAEQERLASYLKNQWEKAFGIHVILKKDDWNSFYSKIKSGNYEIGGFYLFNVYEDPSYLMEPFEHSDTNHTKWESKQYQEHLNLAKHALDKKVREDHLKKAEEILMQEMPVIPVYNHTHLYLCKENLKNISSPKFNYIDFKWTYFED